MANAKNDATREERLDVAGRAIQCWVRDGREELLIDGKPRKFLQSGDAYNIYDDAYAPPQKTLMEAARVYLERSCKS